MALPSLRAVAFLAAFLILSCAPLLAQDQPALRRQDFSADPKWEAFSNRLLPDPPPLVKQDFGYSKTSFAGAKDPGEVGGRVQRSPTHCSCAAVIEEKTLKDKLSASGRFAVTSDEGGSGALFGWFNAAESRGWRTNHSLAIRLDGNNGNYWVFIEYGTRSRQSAGKGAFEGNSWQTTKSKPFPADGTSHVWSITYDPDGAAGKGLITFILDQQQYELPLEPGHKDDGATFDRFGLLNQMTSGNGIEAWFGDLMVDGKKLEVTDKWQNWGSRDSFRELLLNGAHDFGHSEKSEFAGGKPGELGGVIWRSADSPAWYADTIGPLTLKDELSASGTVSFRDAGADSAIYLGWFDSKSRAEVKRGDQPLNVLGILVEGPSRIGHYFNPIHRTATGQGGSPETGPIIKPDGGTHRWSLRYVPAKADQPATLTVTFDDKERTVELPAEHKDATFDRFGIFSSNIGGTYAEIYFDDLAYTAGAGKP